MHFVPLSTAAQQYRCRGRPTWWNVSFLVGVEWNPGPPVPPMWPQHQPGSVLDGNVWAQMNPGNTTWTTPVQTWPPTTTVTPQTWQAPAMPLAQTWQAAPAPSAPTWQPSALPAQTWTMPPPLHTIPAMTASMPMQPTATFSNPSSATVTQPGAAWMSQQHTAAAHAAASAAPWSPPAPYTMPQLATTGAYHAAALTSLQQPTPPAASPPQFIFVQPPLQPTATTTDHTGASQTLDSELHSGGTMHRGRGRGARGRGRGRFNRVLTPEQRRWAQPQEAQNVAAPEQRTRPTTDTSKARAQPDRVAELQTKLAAETKRRVETEKRLADVMLLTGNEQTPHGATAAKPQQPATGAAGAKDTGAAATAKEATVSRGTTATANNAPKTAQPSTADHPFLQPTTMTTSVSMASSAAATAAGTAAQATPATTATPPRAGSGSNSATGIIRFGKSRKKPTTRPFNECDLSIERVPLERGNATGAQPSDVDQESDA